MPEHDAVVVGAGPNGLAAAIALAEAGWRVLVLEAAADVGGGCRSEALTLPGFVHDTCSAVHPMAVGSPFLRRLPLADHGLEWVQPPAACAHPLDAGGRDGGETGGVAVVLRRSLAETAAGLGADARAYRRLFEPLVRDWPAIAADALGPPRWPASPIALLRFARRAILPARGLARPFETREARALVAGVAAHGLVAFDRPPSAAVAVLLLLMAHVAGWAFPRGGAARLSSALAGHLRALGGEIRCDAPVRSLDALPPARAVVCDLSPAPFLRIAGHRLPPAYRRALARYRYGPGVFKVDWALDGPIPWRSAACGEAGTVHLGGTFEAIAAAEDAVRAGRHPERPFVLLTQPSRFDPSRAPDGQQTAWAYCHVPSGSTVDMRDAIEAQVERAAPGFRDRVLAHSVLGPAALERRNPNLVGGDISAGPSTMGRLVARPTWRAYRTPVTGLYLCSASTPPGPGVHGMCGFHAAQAVLRDCGG